MKPLVTRFFLIFTSIQLLLLLLLFLIPFRGQRSVNYAQKKVVLHRFLLTDYCLSTESRHTRHINFPETVAPFQDLAGFHDHFPSSSFFKPQRKRLQITPRRATP